MLFAESCELLSPGRFEPRSGTLRECPIEAGALNGLAESNSLLRRMSMCGGLQRYPKQDHAPYGKGLPPELSNKQFWP